MNDFLFRAAKIIRSQTGCSLHDAKVMFEKTHSIKDAIRQISSITHTYYNC